MIGRVLRPAEGKPDAIILDHTGAVFRHGLAEDRVDVDARSRGTGDEPGAHEARRQVEWLELLECTQCGAVRLGGEPCPHCGFLPQRPPRDVPVADGELGLVAGRRAQRPRLRSRDARERWHRDARPHRERARLQARMGCLQVQGKVRHVPALGQHAAADSTDARGPQLGALAHDRVRPQSGS